MSDAIIAGGTYDEVAERAIIKFKKNENEICMTSGDADLNCMMGANLLKAMAGGQNKRDEQLVDAKKRAQKAKREEMEKNIREKLKAGRKQTRKDQIKGHVTDKL